MYNLAFGRDRLAPHPNLNTKGMGGAEIQANDPTARLVSTPVPGDLVFFHNSRNKIYHVGIYIGDGKMIHAPRTGKNISVLEISKFNGTVHGYYHYD
jgi:cell wall-associated NlpC family hydrolase